MGEGQCGQHRLHEPAKTSIIGYRSDADIEITEECRVLIEGGAADAPGIGGASPNGNWQIPIDAETRQRLEKLRRYGESIPTASSASSSSLQHRRASQ